MPFHFQVVLENIHAQSAYLKRKFGEKIETSRNHWHSRSTIRAHPMLPTPIQPVEGIHYESTVAHGNPKLPMYSTR
jgi:hypothetical protein